MRLLPALILPLLVSACASAPNSLTGLCAGIEPAARAHASALADTADERALLTGDALLSGLEAGCP